MPWLLINNGSFNWIYRNGAKGDGDLILKLAIENKRPLETAAINTMDHYARSVRVWNEINAHIVPPARIEEVMINGVKEIGWVCPFIAGTAPSDAEVSRELIAIFNRTGRIIVDATAKNNFIKTSAGDIVCIDIGMAVQLEAREEACLVGMQRRSSFSSLETWQDMSNTYVNWFENEPSNQRMPETIQTVKGLLFIKEHRPDIENADFLTINPQALAILANAYDIEHAPDTRIQPSIIEQQNAVNAAEHLLATAQNFTLESVKQYCRDKLSAVITPPSSPRQSPVNAQYAIDLLRQVNQCQNIEDMERLYVTIGDMDKSLETEANAVTPIPMQKVPIHRVNLDMLTELEDRDNLNVSKHNCLQILTQFLSQHGKMKAAELSALTAQFSSSPKEKVQYYKSRIGDQTLSDQQKEVLQLIKWIDNAATFEEIDEFILKFELSLPPSPDPSESSYLKRISAFFHVPTFEERLSQTLTQCKLIVATAKSAQDKNLMVPDSTSGLDNV